MYWVFPHFCWEINLLHQNPQDSNTATEPDNLVNSTCYWLLIEYPGEIQGHWTYCLIEKVHFSPNCKFFHTSVHSSLSHPVPSTVTYKKILTLLPFNSSLIWLAMHRFPLQNIFNPLKADYSYLPLSGFASNCVYISLVSFIKLQNSAAYQDYICLSFKSATNAVSHFWHNICHLQWICWAPNMDPFLFFTCFPIL